jgi:predicted methyltransferase
MDISNSQITDVQMYHPEKYLKNFKVLQDGEEVVRVGPNGGNMTAMLKAVVGVKGSSIHNKVLAKHTQHTGGLMVEIDPYVVEVEEVKIMSIGEAKNPQDLVHIELASAESGFLSPDHKKNFANRTKLPSKASVRPRMSAKRMMKGISACRVSAKGRAFSLG